MVSDVYTSHSLAGISLAESGSAVLLPSQLEDEVVSLFEKLRRPVFSYLLSFHISVPDAEEVLQEVFLSLFQHLRRGKPHANLQSWVFKVAHSNALKCRLQARRRAQHFNYVPGFIESTADRYPGPEESLAASERQQRLLAVVRALPEQEQCCLSLRAEGLRYREIAGVLGISLGSVAASIEKSLSRLARAEETRGGRDDV